VIKILEYLRIYNTILPFGNRLFGHTVCVIKCSEVVGRLLAGLLANDGAHVYSVDVTGVQQFPRGAGTRKRKHEVLEIGDANSKDFVPKCDVVSVGVPGEGYKCSCYLPKDGAVCVNLSTGKVS
jgi:methylenetetrahydrofolate dehydrogenase (NAD+)